MFDWILKVYESVDSPESIATIICGALVPIITAIIAVIKKKVKAGSKEERLLSLAWKYGKEFFMAGKKVGEEECKTKVKKVSHKPADKPKDGKKT